MNAKAPLSLPMICGVATAHMPSHQQPPCVHGSHLATKDVEYPTLSSRRLPNRLTQRPADVVSLADFRRDLKIAENEDIQCIREVYAACEGSASAFQAPTSWIAQVNNCRNKHTRSKKLDRFLPAVKAERMRSLADMEKRMQDACGLGAGAREKDFRAESFSSVSTTCVADAEDLQDAHSVAASTCESEQPEFQTAADRQISRPSSGHSSAGRTQQKERYARQSLLEVCAQACPHVKPPNTTAPVAQPRKRRPSAAICAEMLLAPTAEEGFKASLFEQDVEKQNNMRGHVGALANWQVALKNAPKKNRRQGIHKFMADVMSEDLASLDSPEIEETIVASCCRNQEDRHWDQMYRRICEEGAEDDDPLFTSILTDATEAKLRDMFERRDIDTEFFMIKELCAKQ